MKTAEYLNIPIVVTEQYPKGLGHTVPELGPNAFPNLSVFTKSQFSMVVPDVLDHIQSLNKEALVPDSWTYLLCGIEAHVCVLQTALDLRDRGLRVQLLTDAVSSRHPFERFAAFDRLSQSGVSLTTVESAAFQLMGDATHPAFKNVQSLFIGDRPDTGLIRVISSKDQ